MYNIAVFHQFRFLSAITIIFLLNGLFILSRLNIASEGNSSSTVKIENNINTSNTNSSTSKTTTDITIETDGVKKEYHSDKNESVTIESDNGNVKVEVENSDSDVEEPTKANPTPTKVIPTPAIEKDDFSSIINGFFEDMKKLFSGFFGS